MPIAMESDPEVMNKYLNKLGVSRKWRMVDVIGLEEEALSWVPRPVLAVIMLCPLTETYEQHRREQENLLQVQQSEIPKDIFHLKQVLNNVCGTVALIHSIANNTHHIELEDGPLKTFLNDARGLDAAAKGALLKNTVNIMDMYDDVVHGGTEAAVTEENKEYLGHHFVTFVHKDASLLELDGRKSYPVRHGSTTQEKFLEDTVKVCREFISREPDNITFNIVALVSSE